MSKLIAKTRKFFALLFIAHCSLFIAHCYAQQPTQEWFRIYHRNPGGWQGQGPFFAVDKDGNSYVAGPNHVGNSEYVIVIKYDNSGNKLWEVNCYQPGYADNSIGGFTLDTSGNPCIAATYGPNGFAPEDVLITKLDGISGLALWQRNFAGINVLAGEVNLTVDKENSVYFASILGGNGMDSSICVKYNSAGTLQWSRIWHPVGAYRKPYSFPECQCICTDNSSNVILTGVGGVCSGGFCNDSVFVLKYSKNGVLIWDRTFAYYGGTSAENIGAFIKPDNSGNLYIIGTTYQSGPNYSLLTMKFNSTGNLLWGKRFYQPNNDVPQSIAIDEINGAAVLVGYANYSATKNYAVSIYYNSITGDTNWVRRDTLVYAQATWYDNYVDSLGYSYFTGGSSNGSVTNAFVCKFDMQGNKVWQMEIDSGASGRRVIRAFPNGFYLCGLTSGFDYFIGKYNEPLSIVQNENSIPAKSFLGQNFPNPFNPSTEIEFTIERKGIVRLDIFDITGKFVETLFERELMPNSYTIPVSCSGFSSGIYFYRLLINGKLVDTKKMILYK